MNIKIPIRAKIYNVVDGRTAIKAYANVSIGDYLCINSYSIATSSTGNGLVAYRPSVKCSNGKYKKIVEYPNHNKSKLEQQIERACILAYGKYEDSGVLHQDGEPYYIEIEDLIDLNKTTA